VFLCSCKPSHVNILPHSAQAVGDISATTATSGSLAISNSRSDAFSETVSYSGLTFDRQTSSCFAIRSGANFRPHTEHAGNGTFGTTASGNALKSYSFRFGEVSSFLQICSCVCRRSSANLRPHFSHGKRTCSANSSVTFEAGEVGMVPGANYSSLVGAETSDLVVAGWAGERGTGALHPRMWISNRSGRNVRAQTSHATSNSFYSTTSGTSPLPACTTVSLTGFSISCYLT
jgi:hypothetical protein